MQKWIDEQMKGTSVTVVLIGAETSTRPHVGYEIAESHKKGNGMLGIYIHNIKMPCSVPLTKGQIRSATGKHRSTAKMFCFRISIRPMTGSTMMVVRIWAIGSKRPRRRLDDSI